MSRSSTRRAIASPSAAKIIDDERVDPDREVTRDDDAPETPPVASGAAILPAARASAREAMLAQCFVDERNPRFEAPPEDVEELAANIAMLGVLQPLIAVDAGPLGVGILGGRRRLAALKLLHARGEWGDTIPVSLQPDDADAIAKALAENTQRVALSPAQEARAFGRMLATATSRLKERKGASDSITVTRDEAVAAIAKGWGVGMRHVEQRLTLAALHPPILDALDAGEIDLDMAKLYARADAELQAKVWEKNGAGAHMLTVKQALAKKTVDTGSSLAAFVGEAAYVAAGGEIKRDFFGEDDDGAWANRKLAVALADKRLADEKARFEAEGWATVAVLKSEPSEYNYDFVKGTKRPPTDAEKIDLDDIERRQKEISKELAALRKKEDATDDDDRRMAALYDEQEALEARQEALEAALEEFDVKKRAASGVLLFIDDKGALGVWRGVKDKKTSPRGGVSGGPAPKKEPPPEIDGATREAITTQAGVIIGRAIAAHPKAALAIVAADLAREVLTGFAHRRVAVECVSRHGKSAAFKMESDEAWNAQRGAWTTQLKPFWKKPGALHKELMDWTPDALTKLIAFCVAAKLSTTVYHYRPKVEADDFAELATIGAALHVDPGAHWTPDLRVMKGFSEKALRAAAVEIGLDAPATATQPQLAAMVADRAAAVKWTPPVVRQITGVKWTTLHAVKANKTAAKEAAPTKGAPKKAAAKKVATKVATKKAAPKKQTAQKEAA